jgi:hypothetical protein
MGMMKDYLLRMVELTDTRFGQDAIEHAIHTGAVTLTYDYDKDSRTIMQAYGVLCETYQTYTLLTPEPLISLQHDPNPAGRPADVPHAPAQWRPLGSRPAETRHLAARAEV